VRGAPPAPLLTLTLSQSICAVTVWLSW